MKASDQVKLKEKVNIGWVNTACYKEMAEKINLTKKDIPAFIAYSSKRQM